MQFAVRNAGALCVVTVAAPEFARKATAQSFWNSETRTWSVDTTLGGVGHRCRSTVRVLGGGGLNELLGMGRRQWLCPAPCRRRCADLVLPASETVESWKRMPRGAGTKSHLPPRKCSNANFVLSLQPCALRGSCYSRPTTPSWCGWLERNVSIRYR